MPGPKTILVTGATGKQGGAVAHTLLRRGLRVRAMTRTPEKALGLAREGADIVHGDFEDAESLEAACRGADGVFAMSTPFEAGMEAEVRQGRRLADAAKAAGVPHLVYTSVCGADRKTGIPHFETKWQVEERIRGLGIPCTVLRPVFFMENFGTPWYLPELEKGRLASPLRSQTKLQMVALKDIGEHAAAAFARPEKSLGKAVALAGEALTFPEAAAALAKALGHPVAYRQMTPEEGARLLGDDFALMFRWFDVAGYDVDIPALEKGSGIRATRFAEMLLDAPWVRALAAH